ncbi:MAG: hypothetical protein M3O71_05440 [Bacteroidota bacterium]|nr:hypothetical protein [Bacteroidota bacterium]
MNNCNAVSFVAGQYRRYSSTDLCITVTFCITVSFHIDNTNDTGDTA